MSLIRLKDERWPIRIDDKVTAIWVAEAAPTEPSSALDRLLASIIKRPATADYEGKPWPEYYCFGYPAAGSRVYRIVISEHEQPSAFRWNPCAFVGTIDNTGSSRVLERWVHYPDRIDVEQIEHLMKHGMGERFYHAQVNKTFGTFFRTKADVVMAKMLLSEL